ncbi:ATP-dependent helicase [Mycobacterium helveticum]|uniref:DNA 3'-5' helicase n=1 Tax=Mycobacterium helveticum TaxID=2592811 RepID=A0A557XQJ1_9MYCO|nr:ATP-dependent DNA helicase [Mycobacterium helveticum]TVS85000.1 ATP-dependent helicase [Mycobacterium helveticum]TVS88172.1 ATP-dependent helicase [Mycobacterium helveticum]
MSHTWDAEARAVLAPGARGLVRIVGGPGTGKSSLLADAAIARIGAGADPESVLLLTGSGRIGTGARGALTTALLRSRGVGACRAAVREPLVRTVHSYAYAVLRRAAERAGDAPPRLVTSAEQDAIIRELLAGDVADGPRAASGWPDHLRPALGTAGFATELRNLLARCAERGVDPRQLERLGRRCRRPEWSAAGRFARQYEQVMLLRAAVGTAAPEATTPALGAAELVGAALEAFAVDPELLAAERARIRILLVDDAQQLDRQAVQLVRVLAAGSELALVAGDPNQAVFGFRGGEPAGLLADDSPVVALAVSHRCAPAVARAVSGIARRLPGGTGGRQIEGTGDEGSVVVRLAASAHAEAAMVADTLRRAHLVDGIPWSQMAVIVRSVPRLGPRLQHALAAAGVPVAPPALGGPLWADPAARALLTVLQATAEGLDGELAIALLTGPIGRVDPVSLRQLRRALQRARPGEPGRAPAGLGDLLVAALTGAGPPPGGQFRALRRVRAVLEAAARCHRDGQDPRYTLWAAWHRSGLQRRWLAAAERGGPAGAQAGRNLESVTALFDTTDHYVARTSGASLRGLVEHVAALQLPGVDPGPVSGAQQVRVLSAHAALGREWDLVVIAGLQEGLWPNTVPRGGVLGTHRLLDVLDDVTEAASVRAPLLAEERRLLVAAMGRTRRRLVVTAVDGDTGGPAGEAALPSVFFSELAQFADGESETAAGQPVSAPRVLSAAALVGRLRGVVCAPEGAVDDAARRCAAAQLARLAKAGVPGADPAAWHGLTAVSTSEPLHGGDDVVTLTPSTLQTLNDCPLRWLAERHGGTNARELRSTLGSVLHALVAEPGRTESQLLAELERAWEHLPFEARWHSANELARHRAMIEAFAEWRARTRGELTEVGVEVEVHGALEAADGGGGTVRLRGRVDRLERDAAGRLVVVDIKTGKTPVSKDDAQQHAQLAMYQLAVAEGMIAAGDEPGGARLVYLGRAGTAGATEREQDPLTPAAREEWRAVLRRAAAATAGPHFTARRNDGCTHCPIRPCCPAHREDPAT